MGTEALSLTFVVPGKPCPASRPRVSGGRAYYEEPYNSWRTGAKLLAQSAMSLANWEMAPAGVRCGITVWIYGADPRADSSNILKAAEDVCQAAGILKNDVQFKELHVFNEERIPEDGPSIKIKVRVL